MRQQIFHLVGQDTPAFEINVFHIGGLERNGKQLHARLLGRAITLVMIATLTRCNDIRPHVLTTETERPDMIPGQLE